MRIMKVIGTVTLNRSHPAMEGARLRLAVPLSLADLVNGTEPQADTLVVWDQLGAGLDSQIAVSEGPEASLPFRPDIKPLDAYNAAILDEVHLRFDPDSFELPEP
jgi:microcompartment protein CcmK/EutM